MSRADAPVIQAAVPVQRPAWPEDARLILGVSFFAGLAGLYALLYQAWGTGEVLGHFSRGRLLGTIPLVAITAAALAGFGSTAFGRWARSLLSRLTGKGNSSTLALAGFWLAWIIFPALAFLPVGQTIIKVFPRVWIFTHLALAGALMWKAARPSRTLAGSLAAAVILYAGLVRVCAFITEVQAYPFSLGWSEASRFYYASLFRAEALYGLDLPLPTLHPSRYLLQAVPWLLPSLPLWFHRLWQVLLWLGCSLAAGALLARRLQIKPRGWAFLFTAWAALFLLQGPVYYHLAVCALPVLWGLDVRRPWRSLIWVLLASLWAGISRINWIPLPGCLAALLYLLELPRAGKTTRAYLIPPAAYAALGTAAGLASQAAYQALSGAPASEFNSSLASDLLWYRLLPSATYPLGVLPAVILASAGLALVLYRGWKAWHGQIWPLRALGITAILAVFLLGGLVVSVKIGGGSNLHNMDAYLMLLLAAGAGVWAGRLALEDGSPAIIKPRLGILAAVLVLAAPVLPVLQSINPVSLPSHQAARADLAILQQALDQAGAKGGETLFITERHLVPFHYVEGVRMAPDYEKVFLMEMAMAGNPEYLGRFRADLQDHRYALIITEPVSTAIQDRSHGFSEENNVWVKEVAQPLLDSYRMETALPASGVWIMVPK